MILHACLQNGDNRGGLAILRSDVRNHNINEILIQK